MTLPAGDNINPYQAPTTDPGVSDAVASSSIDPAIVKKFRDQIIALGAFWIIIGVIVGAVSVFTLGEDFVLLLFLLPIGLGLVWFVLGVCTCLKQMWAVYVGLVVSYLWLLGCLIKLSVCPVLFFLVVIVQAHRVIKWGRQIRAAGLPLDVQP